MNDRRDEPWLFDLDFGDPEDEQGEAGPGEDEPGGDEKSAAAENPPSMPVDEVAPPVLSDFAFGDDEADALGDPEPGDSFPFDEPASDPLSPDELPLFLDQPSVAAELAEAPASEPEPPDEAVLPLESEAEPTTGPVPVEEEAGGGVAAFRERTIAVAADGLLLVTVLGLCLLGSMAVGGPGSPLAHALPFGAFLVVFSFVYSVVSLAFWGQTPGMAIAGVVARAPGDQPLTFGQTGLRWLGGLLTVALAGLPFLLALTGRSLADRLSGSETFQT